MAVAFLGSAGIVFQAHGARCRRTRAPVRPACIARPVGPMRRRLVRTEMSAENQSEQQDQSSTDDTVQVSSVTDPDLEVKEANGVGVNGTDQEDESVRCSTYTDPDLEVAAQAKVADGEEEQPSLDVVYAVGTLAAVAAIFIALESNVAQENSSLVLSGVFLLGYSAIVTEEILKLNKTAVSLVMASFLWTMAAAATSTGAVLPVLTEKLGDVSEILFFLLGAMTIVEIIDSHEGFKIVTDFIQTQSRKSLLWIVGFVTFFMSSVLDNLTSTIVMVSLLRKLVKDPEERKLFGGVVVIAANAGGAWTPIGDVTTTMLWINGNITALETMKDLLVPSLASLVASLVVLTPGMSGDVERPAVTASQGTESEAANTKRQIVFWGGLCSLIGVPVLKATTGMPPFMGMIAGLGSMWVITDYINRRDDKASDFRRAESALQRVDTSSVLFFLGILLSVGALESQGLLRLLAEKLDAALPNLDLVAIAIGLLSSVIDNVPLVAATMGMYDLAEFPVDSRLWQLIAYCAGTGGSILVIGSAAGVALMGMEKTDFFWYMRKVSLSAAVGFFAGAGVFIATNSVSIPSITALLPGM